MKSASDEPIDQLVRQALERGADEPIPSFDSDRVWSQLKPALPSPPKKRRSWGWWAAACIALWASLIWFIPFNDKTPKLTTKMSGQQTSSANSKTQERTNSLPMNQPVVVRTKRRPNPAVKKRIESTGVKSHSQEPAWLAIKPITVKNSPLLVSESLTVALPVLEPTVTTNPLKSGVQKRFRVVHLNEWKTEEEAQPRLYRTYGLVRLGPLSDPVEAAPSLPAKRPAPHSLVLFNQTKSQ